MAAPTPHFKTTFKPQRKLGVVYGGGKAQLTHNGKRILCLCGDEIFVLDADTGHTLQTLAMDDEEFTCFAESPDGSILVASTKEGQRMVVWDFKASPPTILRTIKAHNASIQCMAFHEGGELLITGAPDKTVMVWDVVRGYCTHKLTGHSDMVCHVSFLSLPALRDGTPRVWAISGSDDATARVWDLTSKKCIVELKNHMSAVTCSDVTSDGKYLITASRDQVINVYEIGLWAVVKCVTALESIEGIFWTPHDSITHKHVTHNNDAFSDHDSASDTDHDSLRRKNKRSKTAQTASKFGYLVTAGDLGRVRIWNLEQGTCLHAQHPKHSHSSTTQHQQQQQHQQDQQTKASATEEEDAAAQKRLDNVLARGAYTNLSVHARRKKARVLVTTADHDILLLSPNSLDVRRRFIGYSDEFTGVCFVRNGLFAASSNSERVHIYRYLHTETAPTADFVVDNEPNDCHVLLGHTDTVLGVCANAKFALIATVSKDKTVRLWDANSFECIGLGIGHTGDVGAIAIAHKTAGFLVSGSSDKTVKIWNTAKIAAHQINDQEHQDNDENTTNNKRKREDEADSSAVAVIDLHAKSTFVAHDKDINAVSISPNDHLIATASQDKTIGIWESASGTLVRRLVGHKRGVWDVQFSPVDKCVASASADKTIKIWSLNDGTCLRTFQGHVHSVLKLAFVTIGMQIVSAGGDGLLKLWTIKNDECVATVEAHENKIWGLATTNDGSHVLTASADSTLTLWRDNTQQARLERTQANQSSIQATQQLDNLVRDKKLGRAVCVAFELGKPGVMLSVLAKMMATPPSDDPLSGDNPWDEFVEFIKTLDSTNLSTMLGHVREWNTTAKNHRIAHTILHLIITNHPPKTIMEIPESRALLTALLAYTDRHTHRLDSLVRASYILDYSLRCACAAAVGIDQIHTPTATVIAPKSPKLKAAPVPAVLAPSKNENQFLILPKHKQPHHHPQLHTSTPGTTAAAAEPSVSATQTESITPTKPRTRPSGDSMQDDYVMQDFEAVDSEDNGSIGDANDNQDDTPKKSRQEGAMIPLDEDEAPMISGAMYNVKMVSGPFRPPRQSNQHGRGRGRGGGGGGGRRGGGGGGRGRRGGGRRGRF